jgi:hypothetical protein
MKVTNLENTEEFHLPSETAKALISAGLLKKVEVPEPVKFPTEWRVVEQFKQAPILRAKCPNCLSVSIWQSPAGNAHKNRFFHVCFGNGPEAVPAEVQAEYTEAYRNWQRSQRNGR